MGSINCTLDLFFLAIGPRVSVISLSLGDIQSVFNFLSFDTNRGLGFKTSRAHERCLTNVDTQFNWGAASLHQDGRPGWDTLNVKVFVTGLRLLYQGEGVGTGASPFSLGCGSTAMVFSPLDESIKRHF